MPVNAALSVNGNPPGLFGTWTPAITAAGTAGTPAYSVQVGSYEQIGRQVTARFFITLSGWTGSPAGAVSITGLPLTSTSTTNDFGSCYISNYLVSGLGALTYGIVGYVAPSTTVVPLASNASTGSTAVTVIHTGLTPSLIGVCSYRI